MNRKQLTAISLMARGGMKPELIAERVGHNDDGALIYRRYRHLFPNEVREAVSMLGRLVAKTAVSTGEGGSGMVDWRSATGALPRKPAWLSERR